MRLRSRGLSAVPFTLGALGYGYALVFAFSASGTAQQVRSLSSGVYSAEQSARGQQLFDSECAGCHGTEMEGSIGPPTVGESFLSSYSESPLATLVDKIHRTMPFQAAGSLSRDQALDLTAYILRRNDFPAGQDALSDATLTGIAFPAVEAAAPVVTAAAGSLPPPEGNVAELMRAIAFPNSNIIFNLQLTNPSDEPKPEVARPFDYRQWGSTIYPGWLAVDQAAIALVETAPLLLTPGRRCQNGRLAPVDRPDWRQAVADVVEVGKLAHAASKARDFDAFIDISDRLNEACDSCHRVYRDTAGDEGGIRGDRCL